MVEGTGLENQRTERFRGFESHPHRHIARVLEAELSAFRDPPETLGRWDIGTYSFLDGRILTLSRYP